MTTNMGLLDRGVRTFVAVAIGVLYLTGRISGAVALVLGALAVIFLVTSLVGWCPLYQPLGISTRKRSV